MTQADVSQQTTINVDEINALIEAERYPAALPLLEQAYKITGKNVAILLNLAFCYYKLDQFEKARDFYRKIVAINPDHVMAINNLAVVSTKLGALEIVKESLINAKTWSSIALEHYFAGNFKLARRFFELAIEIDPQYMTAYYNMGDLIGPEEADLWLERVAQVKAVEPKDQAPHHFLLAQLYDNKKDYKQAINHYKKANQYAHKNLKSPWNHEKAQQLYANIESYFTKTRIVSLAERLRQLPLNKQPIVFIVGMPRSGSTLTSRIIASYADTKELGESRNLVNAVNQVGRQYKGDYPYFLDKLTDQDWLAIHDLYLQDHRQYSGVILLDKYLENFLFAGFIPALFPGAKILVCQRDRRDIFISCFKKYFGQNVPWSTSMQQIKQYYRLSTQLIGHWQTVLPQDQLKVFNYADLISTPETQIAKLEKWLGLPPCSLSLDFHKKNARVESASSQQVKAPLNKKGLKTYQHYEPFINLDLDS